MPLCPDGQQPVLGQCPPSQAIDIDCVPTTNGQPTYTPAPDQVPFAYDPTTGVLWIHVCPNMWTPFQTGLCRLTPANISSVANPCTSINIPITFDNAGVCNEGTLTLGNLAAEIGICLGIGNPPSQTIVIGGTDITVTSNTVNNVTTYSVNYTGNPSSVTRVVSGNTIATHDDGRGNITQIDETITTMTPDGSGGFNYTNEAGVVVNLPAFAETITTLVRVNANTYTYTSENGTVTTIAIPAGARSNVIDRSTGIVGSSANTSLKKRIATHQDGAGTNQDIFETVSTITLSSNGELFAYTDELGRSVTVRLPDSRGVIVWRSANSASGGPGILTANQRILINNDPLGVFNVLGAAAASPGIEIVRPGRYAIGNQTGVNNGGIASNGMVVPVILVNGLANANLPGGGSPYPQNHMYVAPLGQGLFHTTHLVTFLQAGDVVRGGAGVTRSGTFDVTEGYIYYLGE